MNILFCESSPNLGGQELQILLQIKLLLDAGHRAFLVCREHSAISKEASARGIKWHAASFRGSINFGTIKLIRGLLKTERIDVAICHSGHDCDNLAIAARLILKRPFLVRARTYQPGKPKAFTYNHLVDITLVPSRYLKERILQNSAIKEKRIRILHPIIPLSDVRRGANQELRADIHSFIAGASPLIVHAAMLRPEKGHRVVLDSIPGLLRVFPNLKFVFAGQGPELEGLKSYADRLGVSKSVYFAGLVMPVYPLIARASIVVMPSLEEPLGLSQLEALALGVPVAVSDTGGLRETVINGETGWVIAPGDVKEWEKVLIAALSTPERNTQMAEVGRIWVEQRYAPEAHLKALISFFQSSSSTVS